jgi:hypothetical protein
MNTIENKDQTVILFSSRYLLSDREFALDSKNEHIFFMFYILVAGSSRQLLGQLHDSNLGGDNVEKFFFFLKWCWCILGELFIRKNSQDQVSSGQSLDQVNIVQSIDQLRIGRSINQLSRVQSIDR